MNTRYSVAMYTDGPATRWNVIDRQTQEWVRRFSTEQEATEYAATKNAEPKVWNRELIDREPDHGQYFE